MVRNFALVTCALAGIATSANADFFRWDYTRGNALPNSGINDNGGRVQSIRAEYDPTSKRFLWDVSYDVSSRNTNGYWLVVSPGPNPKGHPGELAMIYLDASALGDDQTITPKVTVYNYNSLNNASSFQDGSPAGGIQTPDRIFSSLSPVPVNTVINSSATDLGNTRRFVLELDASAINAHSPMYPNPNGNDWTGVEFGAHIGVWFHSVAGLNAQYGTDPSAADFNYLTRFDRAHEGWLDGRDFETQLIPAPGAFALMGLGVLVAGRRKR
jgi:hypothetical protein